MSTDKQIEANRANAAKSSGPHSPEGKARAAQNARTQGLTAERVVVEGEEAVEFALMVEYGMTPLQAIRSATSVGAENIGWGDRVRSIEKGKYADFVGVSGNPANDVTELERVKFVMKGGQVFRNDLSGSGANVSRR